MDVYENLHGLGPSREYRLFALSYADPEGDKGPDPPEKSQNIGFHSNTGPDPLTNYKATKPAFNVGATSASQ